MCGLHCIPIGISDEAGDSKRRKRKGHLEEGKSATNTRQFWKSGLQPTPQSPLPVTNVRPRNPNMANSSSILPALECHRQSRAEERSA
jgi:hypothetical protein